MNIPQKWKVAAVVLFGPLLALVDGTVISIILPQIQTAFHTDIHTITWVANGYFLAEAAVLPITGYVSDRIGTKTTFLASLALFTLGSLLCSISPTAGALIAFRVMQGIGGGALLPLAMTINYRNFPPNERSKITAVLGIPLVLAPTFGPTIGGYLSTTLNWNAVFLINVPFGIIDLFLAFLILPGRTPNQNAQANGARKSFDILGLVLSLVGVTTLVYGISEAGTLGWGNPTVLTALLIGVVILIAFVVVELRVSDPVLNLRLFLNYTFTITSIVTWLIVGVYTGGLFLLPFFLENVRGDTTLNVGAYLISQGIATAVGLAITGNLYNRVGPRILVVCGLLFLVGGTYGLTQINANTTGLDLQVWLILRGLAVGLVYQPLQTLALSVVSNKGMAKASSLVSVTRQVAIATGVATLTTYLTEQIATHGVGPQAIAAGMANTFWVTLILGVVCILPALFMGRDPAIEAIKKAQQAKVSETTAIEPGQEGKDERPSEHLLSPHVPTAPIKSVISTFSANSGEVMGPEILLWHYPEDKVTAGSLLTVESNQFCILKSLGTILDVYEAGQYIVESPDLPNFGLIQLSFSGIPIPWQYEVLYINRAKLLVKASGVALSREMVEVNYSVDYYIHIATSKDAIRLMERMPHLSHTLTIQEVNTYIEPVIEEAINQLLLITPLTQLQGLQIIQDLSQLVSKHLRPFLSTYGITLDALRVRELSPRDERMKGLMLLKAFGLSELDAVRHYPVMQKNAPEYHLNTQSEEIEQNLYRIWRKTLDRYTNDIVMLQSELENARATGGLPMDIHTAHLQELSQTIRSDLRASLDGLDGNSAPDPQIFSETGQFKAMARNTATKPKHLNDYRKTLL